GGASPRTDARVPRRAASAPRPSSRRISRRAHRAQPGGPVKPFPRRRPRGDVDFHRVASIIIEGGREPAPPQPRNERVLRRHTIDKSINKAPSDTPAETSTHAWNG